MSEEKNPEIYLELEKSLEYNESDACIIQILSGLKKGDYLRLPLVFDLITNKRFEVLDILYKKGIPLSYHDNTGANALHVACAISGSIEAVRFLFERAIVTDVNAQTDEGETPFILSVMYEHEDIVKFLLENSRPRLQIKTIYGETALSLAVKINNQKIVSYLKEYSK